MGCQGSKSAKACKPNKQCDLVTSSPQSPGKTLLGASEENATTKTLGESVEAMPPQATEARGVPAGMDGIAPTSGTYRDTMLRNQQRTLCTDATELDIMVTNFSCHNSTVGNAIGRNCKELHWAVIYDRKSSPIDIKLSIQEHKLHSTGVRIDLDGQPILCGAGGVKSTMVEDFCYQWPLRATIRGISERNFFEIQFPHSMCDTWYPATITGQRQDGFFEVVSEESNQYGEVREVKHPAVDRRNLREALTRKPLEIPEDMLKLVVPKQDPSQAILSLASGKRITHHFGRPSPPLFAQTQELCLQVNKNRSVVAANVGHSTLASFMSGEVVSIRSDVDRLHRKWSFQLGPFAEHTVEITKNHTLGKVITLLVDGKVLVESTPGDIGCDGCEWQCTFNLVGEHLTNFEIFKTNKDGSPLDATDHIKDKRRYVHECKVVLPNDWDFSSSKLLVDGVYFSELPVRVPAREEQALAMDPTALQHTYGITIPYKIDHSAPSDLLAFTRNLMVTAQSGKGITEFIGCNLWRNCTTSSAVSNEIVVQ